MSCGATIDGTATRVLEVLRHMWRNALFTTGRHKVSDVVTFISPEGLGPWCLRNILSAASRSAVPVAGVTMQSTAKPERFSINTCPR